MAILTACSASERDLNIWAKVELRFKDAIDAFGYGIFISLSVLSHADTDPFLVQ